MSVRPWRVRAIATSIVWILRGKITLVLAHGLFAAALEGPQGPRRQLLMVQLTIPAVGVPVGRKNIVSSLQSIAMGSLELGGINEGVERFEV